MPFNEHRKTQVMKSLPYLLLFIYILLYNILYIIYGIKKYIEFNETHSMRFHEIQT